MPGATASDAPPLTADCPDVRDPYERAADAGMRGGLRRDAVCPACQRRREPPAPLRTLKLAEEWLRRAPGWGFATVQWEKREPVRLTLHDSDEGDVAYEMWATDYDAMRYTFRAMRYTFRRVDAMPEPYRPGWFERVLGWWRP